MSWAAVYGSYSVTVSHWSPDSAPGTYYVAVYADCSKQSSAATYILTAAAVQNNDGTDVYLNSGLTASVAVTAGQYKNFRFCVPAHTAALGNADPGVVFIGGTNDMLTNKLIVTSVLSAPGTLAKGVALSGVGIVSPCTILSCTSYTSPLASVTGSIVCTMSSRQKIPGPSYFTTSSETPEKGPLIATVLAYTPVATSFGTITASQSTIAAGMTVADFTGTTNLTRSVQAYSPSSNEITISPGGAKWPADTYTVGLKISGANFASGPAGPNMKIPSKMQQIRGQMADWMGDQCADVVFSWSMTDAAGTPHYPDVIVSRTSMTPQVNSYAWKRTDYKAYGTYTISATDIMARDNHGFLSGSWFVSLYGYCSYSSYANLGVSQVFDADDDLYSGKCRSGDLPTTVTLAVNIVPRKCRIHAPCPCFCFPPHHKQIHGAPRTCQSTRQKMKEN